jgi:hypothetical protein
MTQGLSLSGFFEDEFPRLVLTVPMPPGLFLMLYFIAQVRLIFLNPIPKERTSRTKLGLAEPVSYPERFKNFTVSGAGFVILISMLILWSTPSSYGGTASFLFSSVKAYQQVYERGVRTRWRIARMGHLTAVQAFEADAYQSG